jgi:hypothetical protein
MGWVEAEEQRREALGPEPFVDPFHRSAITAAVADEQRGHSLAPFAN